MFLQCSSSGFRIVGSPPCSGFQCWTPATQLSDVAGHRPNCGLPAGEAVCPLCYQAFSCHVHGYQKALLQQLLIGYLSD